ncbi:hypothetical protein LOTGIDRAFT_155836 [Lottia gigantea]|uniref:Uncharacterized protein n=1 Tax=Lottia gigantea TaxID=225164 RepID=V3ZPM1_LOTGI|nr:hypothetical protein LOTGIDRAFT_155836 [Lottia gigantea]ESO82806.1 hypothetical protein LOTGIDRAFT_155836 [Lottia gigantea]
MSGCDGANDSVKENTGRSSSVYLFDGANDSVKDIRSSSVSLFDSANDSVKNKRPPSVSLFDSVNDSVKDNRSSSVSLFDCANDSVKDNTGRSSSDLYDSTDTITNDHHTPELNGGPSKRLHKTPEVLYMPNSYGDSKDFDISDPKDPEWAPQRKEPWVIPSADPSDNHGIVELACHEHASDLDFSGVEIDNPEADGKQS